MSNLHLFHTNDFHGKLTAERAEKLRSEIVRLSNGEPYVLLDAGDAISAGNLGVNLLGEPILERMSDLGYDALTMGNRETHPSLALVRTKLNRARFPILCGNGYAKRPVSESNLPFQKSVMIERGGKRIGIFGVTVPMAPPKMAASAAWDNLFESPLSAATTLAEQLRPNVDLLIALTHIGITQDRKLAEALPALDLIVGGHSHTVLESPEIVGGVPIVQTGSHARYFGHVIFSDGTLQSVLYPL